MKAARMMILGGALVLASCGNDPATTDAPGEGPQEGYRVQSADAQPNQSLLDRYASANPNFNGNGRRESAREGSEVNESFTGAYGDRNFEGKSYETKAFWGQKDYAKKVYDGDTDGGEFLRSAREGAVSAEEGAMVSRESGRTYDRGRSISGRAREESTDGISRSSDAETDVRRRVYQQPEVRDVQRQRALSVEDTNRMLGR